MGFYINTPRNTDKASFLVDQYNAVILSALPIDFNDIPDDKALICVVDNGFFEAVGYCFSEREFEEFSNPSDSRPKTWLIMDKKVVHELTGYRD